MADVNANIGINIDASNALGTLKELQRQISVFQQSMSKTGAVSNARLGDMQQNLINNINATGQFSASMQRVKSTTESFTSALEKNKLSMGEYFRYAGASTKTFGRMFSNEFDTIEKVARERVKTLQTQYIKLGRDASGAMQAIAVRPQVLDMKDLGTQTAIAAQKAQLFNQLMSQGSTQLLNFGKNTQWAGRQLMVGFTVPLGIMGAAAAREFQKIEEQVIRLERVYGDFTTTMADTNAMTSQIKGLAGEFTKYGVAVEKTIGLAADAAAMGKQGAELTAQVSEANRLAVLGGVQQNQALETTISLTNAFGVSADQLSSKINFLNAVENQTVTSIEDMTTAIPIAAPVIQQLGGNIEDLTFFLTAMKEGGINASEGANALKSGLASLINPTAEAAEMLSGFGINIQQIVQGNAGNVKGIIVDFANALNTLDPLNRAQAIEQLFGKFQFSRMSTLFQNVIAEGTQASRVLDLTKTSAAQLAAMSEKELAKIEESPLTKYQASIEQFKAALAPVGEEFMKAVTPLINIGTDILNAFNNWGDGAKQFAVVAVAAVGAIGPILLMTFGLMANGLANIVKGVMLLRNGFKGLGGQGNVLAEQLSYMNSEQLQAAAVAGSLNQVHNSLIQTFTSEAGAVRNLAGAYGSAIAAQGAFMGGVSVGGARGGKRGGAKKMATGGLVPGSGNGDTVPAMLTPGEYVLRKDVAAQYPGTIAAMMNGSLQKFQTGGPVRGHITMPFSKRSKQYQDSISQNNLSDLVAAFPNSVSVVSNLVAEFSQSLNIALQKGTATIDQFTQDWSSRTGKLDASARLGGADISDPAVKKSLREIEKAIGDRAIALAKGTKDQKLSDELVAKATREVINEYKGVGGAASKAARALDAASKQVGQIRTGLSTAEIREGIASGKLTQDSLGGVFFGDTQVGRVSQSAKNSGKVRPANPIKPSGSYASASLLSEETAAQSKKTTAKKKAAKLAEDEVLEAEKQAKSQSRSDAAKRGWETRRNRAMEQQADIEEQAAKQSLRQRVSGIGKRVGGFMSSGKLGMAGMGLSTGLMMAQGVGGPVGDIAGAISGPLMAISGVASVLGMIPGPAGLVVAGLAAVAGGTIAYNVAMDNAKKSGQELSEAMSMTTEKLQGLSEMTSKQSLSALEASKREESITKIKAGRDSVQQEELDIFKEQFSGSEIGKQFLKDIKTQLSNNSSIAEVAKNMSLQLSSAIADGVLSKDQADAIAEELAKSIKSKKFEIELKGNLSEIVGINGENLINNPGAVANAITGGANQQAMSAGTYAAQKQQEFTTSEQIATVGQVAAAGGAAVAAGGVAAGILATSGTLLGVTAGSAATGVGAPIAIITGVTALVLGLTAAIWGSVEANIQNAKNAQLAASQYNEAYIQNLKMVDSINARYDTLISEKEAQLALATTEEERLRLNQEIAALQTTQNNALDRQKQAQTQLITSAVQTKNALGQGAWDDAQRKQIETTYEDDAVMQELAKTQYNRASQESVIGNETTQATLEVQIASGAIDPTTAEILLNALAENEDLQKNYNLIMQQEGDATTLQMINSLVAAGATDEVIEKHINLVATGQESAQELIELTNIAAELQASGINISVNTEADMDKLKEIKAGVAEVEAMFANGPVTGQVVSDFLYRSTGFELTADQQAYYNSLPPDAQKQFTTSYLTLIETIDMNTEEGRARMRDYAREKEGANYYKTGKYSKNTVIGGKKFKTDYAAIAADMKADAYAQAQSAAAQVQASIAPPPGTRDTGPAGGGGGGGSQEPQKPPTSFLDSLVKDIRDFTNATQGLTEDFESSMSAIRSASANAFSGLSQQLRGVGVGEDVISIMTGMSKEDWDQYKGQFFNFDSAGNVTGFKADLTAIADKLRTITLGKFVDEQQKSLGNLAAQNTALTKLVGLGMTYANAYKLIEDAAFAAAIANAKSAEEIRQIIALAEQARKAQSLTDASKGVSNANDTTDATIAGLNALVRFNSALTDTQTAAILADQDLQVMLANFDTLSIDQLKILNEALQDAANKEALEIKIKMQTKEGMQELFTEGFSKAMEQFSAKEQQIKINFQALRNPFENIINSFTDQIEDIKNAPGGLDDLEADLQRIAEQETDVNEKYKKRFEALDKIQKINDKIAAQQRTQLSLADALSQGDIAAAARAAQEIRAQEAAQALVDQREALSKSQELELESLRGQMNLSREQIEARIRDIKIQIFEIEESQIEPAQYQLDLLKRQEESQINSLTVLGQTKDQWEEIKNKIDFARTSSTGYMEDIQLASNLASQLIEQWSEIEKPKQTIHTIIEKRITDEEAKKVVPAPPPAPAPAPAPAAPANRGQYRVVRGDTLWGIASRYYGNGNQWPKIYNANRSVIGGNPNLIYPGQVYTIPLASGGPVVTNAQGFKIGTDTVPAMLTPGEFVVKKHSVEKFGVDNLKAINDGTFNSGSVYNNTYSITVNAKTGANADEIANTVMAQIKRVDAQRIRGNRF